MISLLEMLVIPTSGGTESYQGVTTDVLQGWQSTGSSEVNIGGSENILVRETLQTQICVVPYKDQHQNAQKQEVGILIVVPFRIFFQEIRALIDTAQHAALFPCLA